jgi:hypothetical protein
MHEVIGGVHPSHAGGKRRRVENITLYDLSRLRNALA